LQYANNCLNICGEEGIFLGAYNIDELAHKVKKWALIKKGLSMNSLLFTEDYYDDGVTDARVVLSRLGKSTSSPKVFEEGSETEAIFEAGQWILENR